MMPNQNNIMQAIQQLKQNTMRIMGPRFNLPQNLNVNDPNTIIQHLLNTGQIKQDQLNQVVNGAMSMRNTIFKGIF